ncbi:hypothetical protein F8M41_016691 [Gigaspora margarita]|uniref:Uncharacterized protein n=1 Tax=Gigaspora margarita TaxID=4874 RepID=A0A8H4ANY5_GIGMA|nr:hypothetical protein F8M41_016691 [Gigaspora margarita]
MNTVGPCCEKEIEVETDEIMKAERKERSGLKEDEKDDDDETIVDEENVEEFRRRNDFKKTKGPTEKGYAEIEETSYASDCYRKGIGIENEEDKGAIKIEKRKAPTVFLVQF